MGIAHFWEIVSECLERVPTSDLNGKTVAVDLAGWVVSAKKVVEFKMTNCHTKEARNFHVRQLFYRVKRLLSIGCRPIFILDGDAPEMKLKTIAKRLARIVNSLKTVKSGKRSFLKQQFKPCWQLLEAMGIAWHQAPGEAEKMCAALQMLGLVDAIITQDGDSVCYGAMDVYRNFSSDSAAEIEKLSMETVKTKVGLDRFDFIVCGILLGCDYFDGIKGVGPVLAKRALLEWSKSSSSRKRNPLRLLDRLMSPKPGRKFSKDQEKLMKHLRENNKQLDINSIENEFKISYEENIFDEYRTGSFAPNLDRIALVLKAQLDYSINSCYERTIAFVLETGVGLDQCEVKIVKKLVKKFDVQIVVNNDKQIDYRIEKQYLETHFPQILANFVSKNTVKTKNPKKNTEHATDIRKYVTEKSLGFPDKKRLPAKRDLTSPYRTTNPKEPKRLNKDEIGKKEVICENVNFSFGLDQVCDKLNSSSLTENPRKTLKSIENTATYDDSSSDEEFFSLADRLRKQ